MKYLLVLALLLTIGCSSTQQRGVVNNTLFNLDVYKDGQKLSTLSSGEVLTIPKHWGEPRAAVSVSAYDKQGNFMGANSYAFSAHTYYNWQVDLVQTPGGW